MSYTWRQPFNLGKGRAGILADLRLQLYDDGNNPVGSVVSTGFVEFGDGAYRWVGPAPDGFAGFGKVYRLSTGEVLFPFSISPGELERKVILGGGANARTLKVTDSSANPLRGIGVTIKNAAETLTIAGPGVTDDNGQVYANLDAGTYHVVLSSSPAWVSLPPQTLVVVDGPGATVTYALTAALGGAGAYTSPTAATIRLLTGLNEDIEEITLSALDVTLLGLLPTAESVVAAKVGYDRFHAATLEADEPDLFTLAVALYVKWLYLRRISTRKVTGTQEPLVMEDSAAIREEAAEAREEWDELIAAILATAAEEAQPTPVALPFLITDSPTVDFYPTPARKIEQLDERDNVRAGWEWQ